MFRVSNIQRRIIAKPPFLFRSLQELLILFMAGVQLLLPTIPTHDLANPDNEILEYGGRDVSEIMGDELSHVHSKAAYQILNNHLIGSVATEATVKSVIDHLSPNDSVAMSSEAREVAAVEAYDIAASDRRKIVSNNLHGVVNDLTKETDSSVDFATHNKFLDLNRPLLPQMWNGGFSKAFYLEQVHRPRYYSKGESAPLFGNFLEPLSLTPWYVVPLIWLPPAIYGTFVANQRMPSAMTTAQYLVIGLLLFPLLVEYWVHRAAHHMDRYVPDLSTGKYTVPVCPRLTQKRTVIFLTIVLVSQRIFFSMAFTTTSQWIDIGWRRRL